eukprot:5940963-Pleurochrysis_carterae.AAC.5
MLERNRNSDTCIRRPCAELGHVALERAGYARCLGLACKIASSGAGVRLSPCTPEITLRFAAPRPKPRVPGAFWVGDLVGRL